ncbi:MAG: AAA family ATPase [Pseudomonadota bacterium]|nr:AAA family ATPase [Pseudomonadota bacterium]
MSKYSRAQISTLVSRLREPRQLIQIVAGARQVGKTTLVKEAAVRSGLPYRYVSADEPALRGDAWLEQQWAAARMLAANNNNALLVVDEAQKIANWSEIVKRLWDEDGHRRIPLKLVLLGSSPLLVQKGSNDSLAGRFEVLHLPHWSYTEMRDAFGWTLDEYLFYGAYPGAATLIHQTQRWRRYICDALIEPAVARDVLLLTRVDKPALLRQVFELACVCSGQILSYNKMLGQLQDAGNTTTIAHYLELLHAADLIIGLRKYAGNAVRRRKSSPKLQVFNNALLTAQAGVDFATARTNREFWGRLVESAVGAHFINSKDCRLYYWRKDNAEVDYIVTAGQQTLAIEVKGSDYRKKPKALDKFAQLFNVTRKLLVGGDGIDVETFLSTPVSYWFA